MYEIRKVRQLHFSLKVCNGQFVRLHSSVRAPACLLHPEPLRPTMTNDDRARWLTAGWSSQGWSSLGVGEAGARFRQHLLLILVHVHGVGPRGFGLWVGVDLSRSQPPRVVGRIVSVVFRCCSIPAGRRSKEGGEEEQISGVT